MKQSLVSLKKDIVEAGRRLYARGFVASNDGNISVRLDDNKILITPTMVSKGFMKPDDLIIINLDGKKLNGKTRKSSEWGMHIQIYKDRPDAKSICHAHPPYATGFAVAGIPLDKLVLPEVVVRLGIIPLAEYGTPGTDELGNSVSDLIKDYDALLMANHGVVAVGSNVMDAYYVLETVEHAAKIQFIAHQLGKVNTFDKKQAEKLTALRGNLGNTKDYKLKQPKKKNIKK